MAMEVQDRLIGYIITAGHLDIEWYQARRSFRFWSAEGFEDLKAAAARGDFVTYVLDGQVFPLEDYLEIAPECGDEMRELVKNGKLSIGPFYTQFDEWLPSAENMIRNCLYGRIKAEAYGGCMRAGYLPDNFGHPMQLPQILNNFNIDSLMFMRGMPEVPGGHPDEFIYEGLDGSRVFACHFRNSYAGAFDIFNKGNDPKQPREVPYYKEYLSFEYHKENALHDDPARIADNLISNVRKNAHLFPSGVIALVSGADHLPPQINVGESVKIANEMQDDIVFIMGTAEGYVREARKRLTAPPIYSMELTGSRYHYILFGALSTRAYLKRENFACEALLERYAEPLTAIASLSGYRDRPLLLDEAWKYLMLNSTHDSIHGSSLDEVHIEMRYRNDGVKQIAAGVIHDTLAYMGRHTRRWWSGQDEAMGVLAYAPAGASFAQPVELWLATDNQPVIFTDESGNALPTQILERERIELNSAGLPRNDMHPAPVFRKALFMQQLTSGKISSFAALPGKPADEMVAASDIYIENEFLRVDVEGALIHLTDKVSGHIWHNLNLLEEEADAGDAWDFSPPWVPGETVLSEAFQFSSKLVEQGAVRSAVELCGVMSVPSHLEADRRSTERVNMPVKLRVTLYKGIRRADIRLTIENTARDHRIRLRVPTGISTGRVLSQGHLAIIDRPVSIPAVTEEWKQPRTQLYPCREWIAVRDSDVGIAIVLKGMYDYEAINNTVTSEPDICVTLLRGFQLMGRLNTIQRAGPASDACDTPDAQCLGAHEIEWAYAPYSPCENNEAPFLPEAQSFLYPPVAHYIRSEPADSAEPPAWQGFDWDAANVQFSAFKKAADDDGYILRFFENQGRQTNVMLPVQPFKRAALSNMNEEILGELDIQHGAVCVRVGAYKAVTIKLYR